MADRADTFLTVMAAIAVVGILAFVVFLVGRVLARPQQAMAGASRGGRSARGAAPMRPQWFEYLLGLVLLFAAGGIALWQLVGDRLIAMDDVGAGADGGRALVFFIVMAAVAVLGLIAFLIFLIVQAAERRRSVRHASAPAAGAAAAAGDDRAAEIRETPSAGRLLGLLLFVVGFLLLNWIYVPGPLQHSLMLYILYPAALAVMLVLLFDKATRAWSAKTGAESFREWLFCDAMALILILGFVNLLKNASAESYSALFWDVLFISLSVLAFWLVDRQQTPFRFLVGAGYYVLLPIQLLIWRAVQDTGKDVAEGAVEPSWWTTVWPVFILALIFFILEVAALLAPGSRERQGLPAFKDVIFYVAFAVLLIIAMPEAA